MWLSAARLSETGVAFARSYVRGVETAIAFAGEIRVFLVRILVAVVTAVSTVAIQGRAVVMGVSCWPAAVVAVVAVVAPSRRHSVQCAKKFALRGLVVGVSAKKFAQRTKNGPKTAVCGVLGEFFRGNAGGGGMLGELFRGPAVAGSCRTNLWCLDGGYAPPIDLGHAHTPRRRVDVALDVGLAPSPRSRVCLPLEARVGASLRPHATFFPQDSSHFVESATHPYI